MSTLENHLIRRLPRPDRQQLLAHCETVPLALSTEIGARGQTTRHVYFPLDSFVSLVVKVDEHPGLEVGMVGHEGMLGAQVSLGVMEEPLRAIVQGAGMARRMTSHAFVDELATSVALRQCMGRYVHVLMAQLAASAACQRFHAIVPRLARWLLMTQDRAGADHFHVTHVFLAYMLGVRRVGITLAAGTLQNVGLIEYHRGDLTVLNRKGLEAAACSCYANDILAYTHYLPSHSKGST